MSAKRILAIAAAVFAWSSTATGQNATGQNAPSVAQRAAVIHSPQPYPDAALRAGHSGTVIVTGRLDADGVFSDGKVEVSSGSDILDAAALAAADEWKFTPATDAKGYVIETPVIRLAMEYTKAFDSDYRCRQFVLDSNWHDRARGRDKRKELRIYATLKGFNFAGRALRPGGSPDDFDVVWDRLIGFCRTHPDEKFRKVYGAL